ncbi:MAG: protein kinase [Mariniblastus sp.]
MKSINCTHCGKPIVLEDIPAQCPHCEQDLSNLRASRLETIKQPQGTKESNLPATITDPTATLETPDDATARLQRAAKVEKAKLIQHQASKKSTADSFGTSPLASPTIKQEDAVPNAAAPTLKTPPPSSTEPTLITPSESQRAAENYSLGLDTVIPPRSVSRTEHKGQLQDYKVEDWLGSGAFGVVFRAIQVPLDRSVAVKVLQESEGESDERNLKLKNEFLREAQFTGKLEHPNIVPIHDIGVTTNEEGKVNPFYAMKEIRGQSWLQSMRTKTKAENLEIFKHVANAVGFAHSKNILHCDLKPDNVMLGEFGEVLLVDWGQAVDLLDDETMRPGGTPAYISPEMATYWSDIYLDRRESSPARALVGPKSDVYLLGAVLFELIVGYPPHCNTPNEHPYEVIRRASENELVSHTPHVNDELMQIALCALRHGEKEYQSVEEMLAAVNDYETRKLSIELRQRAYEVLESAKQNSDYDGFQRARYGFEESLQTWDGNNVAKRGLRDARVSCAELSLKDQNFDLGIGMLDNPETQDEVELKQKLVDGKNKRDRRKKLVGWLAAGLAGSILLGIVANGFMINENYKSAKLRDEALEEKGKIEASIAPLKLEVSSKKTELATKTNELAQTQNQIKQQAVLIERNQEQIAEFPKRLNAEKEKFNLEINTQAKQFAVQAEQSKRDLELQLAKQLQEKQKQFDEKVARQQAESNRELLAEQAKLEDTKRRFAQEAAKLTTQLANLGESSKLLRYKSNLSAVAQRVQAGDYRESRKLLDSFEDKTNWEWSRLNQMSHREVKAIYPSENLIQFAASRNGKRFGLVFDDRIEVRQTDQFEKVAVNIPVDGATAIGFSTNGEKLAIGRPADSVLQPGKIWILDLSNPSTPRQELILDAQSRMISCIEFSTDGRQVLSVGVPSKSRQSTSQGLDEALMVWGADGKRVEINLVVGDGKRPIFSTATFSNDGTKILTANPNGLPQDQRVHLFSRSQDGIQWNSTSPFSGINTAIFANDSGTRILGCVREPVSGTFTLSQWPVVSSGDIAAQQNLQTIAQLEQKALAIRKSENWLVTSGQDKAITLWDWQTKTSTTYKGHARDVDANTFVDARTQENVVLISVATGAQPEILKTDLSTYQQDIEKKPASRVIGNDEPSLTTFRSSTTTSGTAIAMGNDLGQASVERDGKKIQWDVSAWTNHILSKDYLFAQSRDDYFYKYNRATGGLETVITQLRSSSAIDDFQVALDGNTALIVRDDGQPVLEIWNLAEPRLLRTIDYGKENVFGTGTEKELLTFKLSPNGEWVVGGKVGLFAWSTRTGEIQPIKQPRSQMARNAISSINFLDDSSKFLASWKDRVDLIDLNSGAQPKRFNTSKISYSKNEPNVLDARIIGDKIMVLAKSNPTTNSAAGIVLLDLKNDSSVTNFSSARFAKFSDGNPGNIIVVNKPGSSSLVQRWSSSSNQTTPISLAGLDGLGRHESTNSKKSAFETVERAYENTRGRITIQSSTKSRRGAIARDWNTATIDPSDPLNPVTDLRVIAKPPIESCGLSEERAFTFDSGKIRFWNLRNGSVQPAGIANGTYGSCDLSHDGKVILATSTNGSDIVGIDIESGSTLFKQRSEVRPSVVAWSPNSNSFAVGGESGSIELWTFEQGTAVNTGLRLAIGQNQIKQISFSKTGQSLAAVSNNGSAFVSHKLDSGWGRPIAITPADGQKIAACDISDDGQRVIAGTTSGRLTIWNSETSSDATTRNSIDLLEQSEERELLNLQNQHQSPVKFVKFVTNSKGASQVVSGEANSGKNEFLIWNVAPAR